MTSPTPSSLLVVCRQRLDVLEQQAKAAGAAEGYGPWTIEQESDGLFAVYDGDRCLASGWGKRFSHYFAAWSPAAVLALCGWIRQTLDGAENVLALHGARQLTDAERDVWGVWCQECAGQGERGNGTPCPWFSQAASTITGLAAVLAPTTKEA